MISNFSKFYIAFVVFNLGLAPIFGYIPNTSIHGVDFLSSALGATSAIVAIVFSILIIAVQHAASSYTPIMLSSFGSDKKVWFTLAYGILTIMLLSVSLVFNVLFWVNLFCFFNFLGLLAVFFLYTLEKINPISIVEYIQDSIVDEYASIKNKRGYELVEERLPQIDKHKFRKSKNTQGSKIMEYELALRQIVVHAKEKEDYDTCRKGLGAYPKLFESYLNIIPDIPWSQDKTLDKKLDYLKSYKDMGLENNDHVFLKALICEIKNSGEVFIKNAKPPERFNEQNEQLKLCMCWLKDIADVSENEGLWDVTENAMEAIADLGERSCSKYLHEHMAFYTILEIVTDALEKKNAVIAEISIGRLFGLIQAMIKNVTLKHILTPRIDHLAEMLQSTALKTESIKNIPSTTKNGPLSCVEQCFDMQPMGNWTFSSMDREESGKDIITSLINLISKAGRKSEHEDLSSDLDRNECLVQVSRIISQQKSQTFKKDYAVVLKDILGILIRSHNYGKTSGDRIEYDIHREYQVVVQISEVILYCLQNDMEDVAMQGIEEIVILAYKILEEHKHYEDATGTIRKLDIIGCYGFAKNKEKVSKIVAEKYLEFEQKIKNKDNEIPENAPNYSYPFTDYRPGRGQKNPPTPPLWNIQMNGRDSAIGIWHRRNKYTSEEYVEHIIDPENWEKFVDILSQMRNRE